MLPMPSRIAFEKAKMKYLVTLNNNPYQTLLDLADIEQARINALPLTKAKWMRALSVFLTISFPVTYYSIFLTSGLLATKSVAWYVPFCLVLLSAAFFYTKKKLRPDLEENIARCKHEKTMLEIKGKPAS